MRTGADFIRKARSLPSHMAAVACAVIVPFLVAVTVAVVYLASVEQRRLEDQVVDANRALLELVDNELHGRLALLTGLATSPVLDGTAQVLRFREQTEALPRDLDIVLVDGRTLRPVPGSRSGETAVKLGTELVGNLAGQVIRTRKPVISDLVDVAEGPPVLSLAVPVIRDQEVRYLLLAMMRPEQFMKRLVAGKIQAPFIAALADRQGRIIARSVPDAQKVGMKLPGFADLAKEESMWSGLNSQGIAIFGLGRKSQLSGWMMATGVAQAAMKAPVYRSAALLAAVALCLVALSGGFIWFVGRRLAGMTRHLIKAARSLSLHQPLDIPPMMLREGNEIGSALIAASNLLKAQAAALVDANLGLERRVEERTEELQSALVKAEKAERAEREANRRLADLATTDALTGLPNRRKFDDELLAQCDRGARDGTTLSLLLIDADHFKSYNDSYGHDVGDEILRALAQSLKGSLHRPTDSIFRVGGEEFAVILPDTEEHNAELVASRLHAGLGMADVAHAGLRPGTVTVSIGLASRTPSRSASIGPADLYRLSDQALYAAKRGGRNRTNTADQALAQSLLLLSLSRQAS